MKNPFLCTCPSVLHTKDLDQITYYFYKNFLKYVGKPESVSLRK